MADKHTPRIRVTTPARSLDQCPVAMAYVPWQSFEKCHDAHTALHRGTLFAELEKPFKAAKEARDHD